MGTADVPTMKPSAFAILVASILWAGIACAQAAPVGPTLSPPLADQGPASSLVRDPAIRSDDARSNANAPPYVGPMRWYGWETLVVDAGGISAFLAAVGSSNRGMSTGLVELGLATYVLGAPIVHAAEGHPREAGLSVGLRLGAPLVGGLSGFLLGGALCAKDDGDVPCPALTAALGILAGGVAAIAVDAEVLSDEPEPSRPQVSHFAPTLSVTKNGVSAGLTGAF